MTGRRPISVTVLGQLGAGLCLLACLTAGAADSPPARAEPDEMRLRTEGTVEIARAGSPEWSAAADNQVLRPGDRVRTSKNSRALLISSRRGRVRVRESSEFIVQPPSAGPRHPLMNLLRGYFHFFDREKALDVDFQGRLASATTRGTDFVAVMGDDNRIEVTVLDGEVDLRNEFDGITLTPGTAGEAVPGRGPMRRAGRVEAVNLVQWCLYYPAVLDLDDLELTPVSQAAWAGSWDAYRRGDLPGALRACPPNHRPASDSERIYAAALVLAAGEVPAAESLLAETAADSRPAAALRQLIAAVQGRERSNPREPASASEWLAESYYLQSRASVEPDRLEPALEAARNAAAAAPGFGLAWARVAELEFSFGRTTPALRALDRALELSPANANALATRGFLLSAQNRIALAIETFDAAIRADGSLANAWLGRGLCHLRCGEREEGLSDLLTAAALEPQRALLRSYLGKALADRGDRRRATQELSRARQMDSNDPSPWLYTALLHQQNNRINEAIDALETSLRLNDNRSLFRSRLLLDQDRAVSRANLAALYREAGLQDVSVREAARAVDHDYANPSAHLFVSDSFNELRDPTRFNLRYETVWFGEYLLANLLAPVGGGRLSHHVSAQEYARLFEADGLGLASSTFGRTDGEFHERASQYGAFRHSAWSLDVDYQHNDGVRPNNDLDRVEWYTTVKQELTPRDSLLLLAKVQDYHAGDNFQYENPAAARRHFTFDERQEPILLGGYRHAWGPGMHTLLLAGRLVNEQHVSDLGAPQLLLLQDPMGALDSTDSVPLDVDYHQDLEIYTGELNHIVQRERWRLVAGCRLQSGQFDTEARLDNPPPGMAPLFSDPAADGQTSEDFERAVGYGYVTVQPLTSLSLTAGVAYDYVKMPSNLRHPPLSPGAEARSGIEPKAAVVWTPCSVVSGRAVYAQSLGGVSLDESYRLEPAQLAGFPQTYRAVISESVAGSVAAPEYETLGVALDLKPAPRTYAGIEAVRVVSDVRRTLGVLTLEDSLAPFVSDTTPEHLDYEELTVAASLHRLIGEEWVLGGRYGYTRAELRTRLPAIPAGLLPAADRTERGDLHHVNGYALYTHASGFYARADVHWYHQENRADSTALSGDDFFQCDLFAGYRFARRRAAVTVGVLNLGDTDYRLAPLTVHAELPRERVFLVRLDVQF